MERYAVIMPAKNEEKYIGRALESVVNQTILPRQLVVVSDGSTDRTDQIASEFERAHDFITFTKRKDNEPRNFGSKVRAFNTGLEQLDIGYDFLANLDADITLEKRYYEKVMNRFDENPRLGLSGGIINERCGRRKNRGINNVAWSVAGGVQVFRRECYESTGGYEPLEKGGVDAIMEVKARMNNWEVRAFSDITAETPRRIGTSQDSILTAAFKQGIQAHSHGSLALFELLRCINRFRKTPYIIAGATRFAGYISSKVKGNKVAVSDDVRDFLRQEQWGRLLKLKFHHN